MKMDDSTPKTPEISKSLSRELEEVISKQNLLTSRTRRRVLVSLQEQTNKEEDAEMEKLRQKAIDEIINSEKSYLRQLEIVDEFFMKPLQDSGHLDTQIYASIFGKSQVQNPDHVPNSYSTIQVRIGPGLKIKSNWT